MTDELMTVVQAATLKKLAQDAYELDAFKPNLTRPEADKRIAMLTAKLKLLDGDISESVRPRHQLLISGFSCRITFSNERWTSMRPL